MKSGQVKKKVGFCIFKSFQHKKISSISILLFQDKLEIRLVKQIGPTVLSILYNYHLQRFSVFNYSFFASFFSATSGPQLSIIIRLSGNLKAYTNNVHLMKKRIDGKIHVIHRFYYCQLCFQLVAASSLHITGRCSLISNYVHYFFAKLFSSQAFSNFVVTIQINNLFKNGPHKESMRYEAEAQIQNLE